MIEHWPEVFGRVLKPAVKNLVFELKEARKRWAHEEPFTLDQAYRAVDSVQLLLVALRVDTGNAALERLKQRIRAAQMGVRGRETAGTPARPVRSMMSGRQSPLSGTTLRIAQEVLREGNPPVPYTHGWLAFEVLRGAEGGRLPFDVYLFNPDPEIEKLAGAILGVPNAYQDVRHIRHDIAKARVYVE